MYRSVPKIAAELLGNKGKAIVISGSNDPEVQKIVIGINTLLDSYGNTFDMKRPILTKQGSDHELFDLVNDMKSGKIGALFFYHSNRNFPWTKTRNLCCALIFPDNFLHPRLVIIRGNFNFDNGA